MAKKDTSRALRWIETTYKRHLASIGMSRSTVEAYASRMRSLFRDMDVRTPEALTTEIVLDHAAQIAGRVNKRTISVEISAAKHALELLGRHEGDLWRLHKLSYGLRRRPRPGYGRRVLTEDEERRLLEAAEPDARLAYRLALEAGMRIGEVVACTRKWHCPEKSCIVIPSSFTKSGRIDVVRLPSGLNAELESWFKSNFRVVRHRKRKLQYRLYDDLLKAGVEQTRADGVITFHSLRHTFVTRLCEAGTPIHLVRALARHANARTTLEVYAHERESQSQEWLDRAHSSRSGEGPGSLRLVS